MRFYPRFSVALGALFLLVACERAADFYPLSIETKKGTQSFQVEVADTDTERARGLMFREHLDSDKGMLFVFDGEAPRAFWMKNTLIPLDMLFIRSNGTIAHIFKNAQPHDETGIPSESLVRAVLEIPGGEADKRGIKVGDRVVTDTLKQESAE